MPPLQFNIESKNRQFELDSIRGLAALLITFFHFPKWNPVLDTGLINNGYLAVDLFFVLSGYVIFDNYFRRVSNLKDFAKFLFKRIGRIYPVHILFLLFFLIIEFAKWYLLERAGIPSSNSTPFHENNITAFFQQVILSHAIGPTGNASTFNGPSWSLSVELYLYLIFGIVILLSRNVIYILIPLVVTSAFTLLLITKPSSGWAELLTGISGFFLGGGVFLLRDKNQIALKSNWTLFISIILIGYVLLKTPKEHDQAMALLSALLIFSLVSCKPSIINSALNHPWLVKLGEISFSVYMSHVLIQYILNQVLRFVFKYPDGLVKGAKIPQLPTLDTIFFCGVSTILTIVISCAIYKYIENPCRIAVRNIVD